MERQFKTLDSRQLIKLLPGYVKKRSLAAVTLEELEQKLKHLFQGEDKG